MLRCEKLNVTVVLETTPPSSLDSQRPGFGPAILLVTYSGKLTVDTKATINQI